MNRRKFLQGASLLAVSPSLPYKTLGSFADVTQAPQWLEQFKEPPDSSRPWVYSFWMEGNITKEGIRADLEGMKEAGIGGLLFMDGSLTNPPGPERFMSDSWIDLFAFMVEEAGRLGLEINLNNDPGWAGSGGPWITPELATQRVIFAENVIEGGTRAPLNLPKPSGIQHNHYKDIAVLAYPLGGVGLPSFRIPNFGSTKSFAGYEDYLGVVPWPRFIPTNTEWPEPSSDQIIHPAQVVDLTAQLDANDKLNWTPPAGRWLVMRIGHTVSNGETRESQPGVTGLECDKMSKTAVETHFNAMVGKLSERVGALVGKTLVSAHIDSWESGSGNWTADFRSEFQKRNGYDLLPYLPTLNGIVVDSRAVSERFLWDFRETASQLLLENYAGHMRELANAKGLRLSIEAYDGTVDDLRYAGRADEPMTEFWRSIYSGLPLPDLSEEMASAAHVYGRNILAAESFTSQRGDFVDHPANMKPLADWAFCTGVNRICFSEWVMQPWPDVVPGVSFWTTGTVFHRSLTWWQASLPWHRYIARCQHLLRQGTFVADICFIAPEGAPYRFTAPIPAKIRGGIPDRPMYNFDGCPAELILEAHVENGDLVLPSGMRYRLLVLPTYNANGQPVMRVDETPDYAYNSQPMPKIRTMTPALLRKVRELVEAGATILGHRPLQSPSLSNFPHCDTEIQQIAHDLWGKNDGITGVGERNLGKGRVIWGKTPEEVFAAMHWPPDFTSTAGSKLNYTHRRTQDGADIYYVVNKEAALVEAELTFRVANKQPAIYCPQSGEHYEPAAHRVENKVTTLPLALNPHESAFVVFREGEPGSTKLAKISNENRAVWPVAAAPQAPEEDAFTIAFWVSAFWASFSQDIALPGEHGYEGLAHPVGQPAHGALIYLSPGEGYYGAAVGQNGIVIFQYGVNGEVQPILVHAASLPPSTHIGVDYKNRIARLYIDGKLAATSKPNPWLPRPSPVHRPCAGELAALDWLDNALHLQPQPDAPPALDLARRIAWQSGVYTMQFASGETRRVNIALPLPQAIAGSWDVAFDPAWGGPAHVSFAELQDWSIHPDDGIRFYSGTAVYTKNFEFTPPSPGICTWLDLGRVAVIAEVYVNGNYLGILWNKPYRIDITDALHSGQNALEIRIINCWVNRLIGDEHLPQDSDRTPDGVVKTWPLWLLERRKSPTGRFTFSSARQWEKNSTLLPSGLLGPVQLRHARKIEL
jgi:hypothetical protein